MCHCGHYKALSRCRLVGSCVSPSEKFFRRPTTTFARLTQSQAISKSIAISSLSHQWEIRTSFTFFHFFETPFSYSNRFLNHGDQKISWWRICRWRAVNFEIHLWSSGVSSDLGECFFWGLCKLVIASTDLWPKIYRCLLLRWSCLKLRGSFGAYVYHRRPLGLHRHRRSCLNRLFGDKQFFHTATGPISDFTSFPKAFGSFTWSLKPYLCAQKSSITTFTCFFPLALCFTPLPPCLSTLSLTSPFFVQAPVFCVIVHRSVHV